VPVIFPEIHPGATLLLPFRINVDPVAKSWQLMQDSGYGLTFPVEAKMIIGEKPADNPRAFLTREIANSFSYGSPAELGALWNIACQNPGYLPELMPLLESPIGNNQHQWAAIAAAELAGASGAEWRIDNILNDVEPDAQSPRAAQIKASYQFIRQALQHLPNERAAQKLVIHDIVFNAAAYGDYSTVGLTNYLDDPVFVEDLRSALRKKIPGSVTIASKLATKIPTDCRAEALKRALDVADHPGAYQPTGHGDVYSSMVLIKEYGTLAQRRQLAAISAKYRATYPEYAAFLARWAR